eukprot:scaffold168165_cov19-Tisochrysis_lutea.AAC.1
MKMHFKLPCEPEPQKTHRSTQGRAHSLYWSSKNWASSKNTKAVQCPPAPEGRCCQGTEPSAGIPQPEWSRSDQGCQLFWTTQNTPITF